jgi:hypothetical protein
VILSCLKFRRLSTRRFPPVSDPLLSECAEASRVARGARLGSPALPFAAPSDRCAEAFLVRSAQIRDRTDRDGS